MSRSKRRIASAALGLGTATSGFPMAAAAQAADGWQFQTVIYGYLPDIGGRSAFPPRTGGADVNVDASTIIDNLKFVFMGTFEARKDRWGFFTDLMYLDVGGSKSGSRGVRIGPGDFPAGVTADLGWRYLDYNFKSGSKFEDVNFNGPIVGVAFRW